MMSAEDSKLIFGLALNGNKHVNLSEENLACFRTRLCKKHIRGKCIDSEMCANSHCRTWQRRNPSDHYYIPKLCPDISFVKTKNKMSLVRRCGQGRRCVFAHSKEEELYHPLMYKTKLCTSYPLCTRYFCPFAHNPSELRFPGESQEKVTTPQKNEVAGSKMAYLGSTKELRIPHKSLKQPAASVSNPVDAIGIALGNPKEISRNLKGQTRQPHSYICPPDGALPFRLLTAQTCASGHQVARLEEQFARALGKSNMFFAKSAGFSESQRGSLLRKSCGASDLCLGPPAPLAECPLQDLRENDSSQSNFNQPFNFSESFFLQENPNFYALQLSEGSRSSELKRKFSYFDSDPEGGSVNFSFTGLEDQGLRKAAAVREVSGSSEVSVAREDVFSTCLEDNACKKKLLFNKTPGNPDLMEDTLKDVFLHLSQFKPFHPDAPFPRDSAIPNSSFENFLGSCGETDPITGWKGSRPISQRDNVENPNNDAFPGNDDLAIIIEKSSTKHSQDLLVSQSLGAFELQEQGTTFNAKCEPSNHSGPGERLGSFRSRDWNSAKNPIPWYTKPEYRWDKREKRCDSRVSGFNRGEQDVRSSFFSFAHTDSQQSFPRSISNLELGAAPESLAAPFRSKSDLHAQLEKLTCFPISLVREDHGGRNNQTGTPEEEDKYSDATENRHSQVLRRLRHCNSRTREDALRAPSESNASRVEETDARKSYEYLALGHSAVDTLRLVTHDATRREPAAVSGLEARKRSLTRLAETLLGEQPPSEEKSGNYASLDKAGSTSSTEVSVSGVASEKIQGRMSDNGSAGNLAVGSNLILPDCANQRAQLASLESPDTQERIESMMRNTVSLVQCNAK